MALTFNFINYKDTYTLSNSGSADFSYSLYKSVCQVGIEGTLIFSSVLPAGKTKEIKINLDGEYYIYITDGTDDATVPAFKVFTNLVTSFIATIENIFCGCSTCKDCEEEIGCNDYLNSFMEAQGINILNFPKYNTSLDSLFASSNCLFTKEVQCYLLKQKIYGSASIKDVLLQVLSYYYLSFYYVDLSLTTDEEEGRYTIEKYKFNKIRVCMNKLGIDTTDPSTRE